MESKRRQQQSCHEASDRSSASTIRKLPEKSNQPKGRQREDGIPDALITEVLADGLITDQRDARSLHISDHIIVVSSLGSNDQEEITTFRHRLLGEWRADRTSGHASTVKNMDSAYFFFQVRR
jgi:hypothetical protein